MKPEHLRTFLAVQKHLNYTHAARELLLSQPAVSRQIRQLENALGVRLFEQLGKRLHLTDAGKTLLREASRLLGGLDRVREALLAHQDARRGALRIGASTTPGFYLLPSVLGRFHRSHPEVEVSYMVANSHDIADAVLSNEIDLGFVGTRLSTPELVAEPIARDEIVFFASASHPLAARKRIELAALAGETWVAREKGSATRKLVERRLARARIGLDRAVVLGCPEAVKALVAGGFGVSFLSLHGLREDFRRGRVARLPVADVKIERTIHAVRHKDKHESPVLASFLALAREELRGLRRG
jgi:DNA-binding transcriptional LysR family regulator